MRRASEPDTTHSNDWSMPAPVRGWNARDSLAHMQVGDAIALDNWFPSPTAASLREGSVTNATLPVGRTIKSLLGLSLPDGSYKRFAGANDGIYDITAGGAIAAVSSAATTGQWESVQLTVGGVSFLWACAGDGVNKSRAFRSDTSTWVLLDGASVPVLTGPDSTKITNVSLWKYRLILTEKDSLKFWYGPLNSVGGVFQSFDLGQVFKRGGHLVATFNWTVDAGDGADDRFLALTSEGEIAVYQGTDPSSSPDFQLIGVFFLGKPVGAKPFVQLAGDVGVLTEQGIWPVASALVSSQTTRTAAITDRIQGAFVGYTRAFAANFGWSMTLLPKGPALLVNVPLSDTISYQFVMNTTTGAWCRFLGWSSSCMTNIGGDLYFALDNVVKKGWTGFADDASAITAYSISAYAYSPHRYKSKKIALVRPLMTGTGTPKVAMALDTDFNTRTGLTVFLSSVGSPSVFDAALYDSALWGGALSSINTWKQVPNNPGKAFSLRLKVQCKNISLNWAAVDFISEPGGLL